MDPHPDPNPALSFVLVHGAAHGAWCWEPLVPHLEADPRVGHVMAVDLAGHGERRGAMPLEEIQRADYIDDVVRAIEDGDLRNVMLVGHSLAGITIPWVAARVPERIRHLVFLATTNPPVGQSVNDVMATHPLSPLQRGVTDFTALFCNDLDEKDTHWLTSQLVDEPPGPMGEAMEAVELPHGLPSTYVLLERDATLPLTYQREQAKTIGVERVVTLDCGHSAFVARPRELAELLLGLA